MSEVITRHIGSAGRGIGGNRRCTPEFVEMVVPVVLEKKHVLTILLRHFVLTFRNSGEGGTLSDQNLLLREVEKEFGGNARRDTSGYRR